MSRDASISLKWADGTHKFRLGIGELRELQEKLDAGPEWIWRRINNGEWRVDDIREIIRIALIGGGTRPDAALKLVERYIDPYPIAEHLKLANAVIGAALFGAPDGEKPGKRKAAKQAAEDQPSSQSAESSASLPSTDPVQS